MLDFLFFSSLMPDVQGWFQESALAEAWGWLYNNNTAVRRLRSSFRSRLFKSPFFQEWAKVWVYCLPCLISDGSGHNEPKRHIRNSPRVHTNKCPKSLIARVEWTLGLELSWRLGGINHPSAHFAAHENYCETRFRLLFVCCIKTTLPSTAIGLWKHRIPSDLRS
jgi:hypothetical protein